MWIGGSRSLQQFDNFKAEIFGKKKDAFKEKYKQQRPEQKLSDGARPQNHPFFRKMIWLSILSTSFYFANEKFKIINRVCSYTDTIQMHPILKATIKTLVTDMSRRMSTNPEHHTLNETKNIRFANSLFLAQLQQHLKKLEQKNVPKIISEQKNSRVSFGPFKFGCRHEKLLVTSQGNVVRESYKAKAKIGGMNMIGEKIEEVLERESTADVFMKYKQNDIEGSCKAINIVNRIFVESDKYEHLYMQCTSKSLQIMQKIEKNLKNRQKKQYKNPKRYIINFS